MDTMLAKGDISHFESANETPLSFTKLSFEGVDTTSDTKIFDINTEIRIIPEEYTVDVTDANSNVKSGIQLGLATKHLLLTGDAAKFDINTNKDAVPTIKYVKELVPTKTSQLTNDSNFITNNDINGKADKSYVDEKLSKKQDIITGNSGEVVYHNGSNVFTQQILNEGFVCPTEEDVNICKNNSHKQYRVVTHILKDHTYPESVEKAKMLTPRQCMFLFTSA